ncbi:MAG: uroporphyrinogen decarboxylase family protein, partial [Monoglobales bacterium]
YGLEKRPIKVIEPYQMLGKLDDDLKELLGMDTLSVPSFTNMFGIKQQKWKEWTTPHGVDVLIPEDMNMTYDENNVYVYPEGDLTASPSAKMPDSSHFFDAIIRQEPIDEDLLNPEDNLEEFSELSDEAMDYYKTSFENAAKSGKAVIANIGGTALGDIALVPAPFLKNPKGIRDITEWYMSTAIRQDYIHQVFEKQTDIALKNLERVNRECGENIDIMYICGTDFGTQISTFCSADTFRELYMPYYKKLNNWIHKNTKWKTFKHSCGAIEPFIPLMIESGFDILNPVQCSAMGMDPVTLKEKYGDSICFWGGGVDTQHVLPFGTPQEVSDMVKERCEIFGKGGGFVFSSIHNIQAKTPVANIVAMFDAFNQVR